VKKKETSEQRKLREAAELVKAAKEAERKAWQDKWKAQQADPEYQRKQAERQAKSEERSRKMAIGKENKRLEFIAKYAEHDLDELYETAVHESCHAVMSELVANGVSSVTIVPGVNEAYITNGITKDGVYGGCASGTSPNIGTDKAQTIVWRIASTLAPQVGMPKAFEYYQDLGVAYDPDIHTNFCDEYEFLDFKSAYEYSFTGDENILKKVFEELRLSPIEAFRARIEADLLIENTLNDPKVWAAVLEVADALMTEKTLSGNDVRLIVRKNMMPQLDIKFDVGKQLSFHYRKNRYIPSWGAPPDSSFVLGIGVMDGGYVSGYHYAHVKYADEVVKANAKPVPFPCKPAFQASFTFPPHAAPAVTPVKKKARRKGVAA